MMKDVDELRFDQVNKSCMSKTKDQIMFVHVGVCHGEKDPIQRPGLCCRIHPSHVLKLHSVTHQLCQNCCKNLPELCLISLLDSNKMNSLCI